MKAVFFYIIFFLLNIISISFNDKTKQLRIHLYGKLPVSFDLRSYVYLNTNNPILISGSDFSSSHVTSIPQYLKLKLLLDSKKSEHVYKHNQKKACLPLGIKYLEKVQHYMQINIYQ